MRTMPVQVTATAPLTVSFPDGSTHAAIGLIGATYSTTAGHYVAFTVEGQPPFVLPTGTTTGGTGTTLTS